MLKKRDLGINPYVANNGSRDQSLTGIGGPRVTLHISPSPVATHEAAGGHRLRVSVEEDVLHEADQASGE